ncbi:MULTISPECIES: ATP-binding cassette domain-containing protein [unclassified Microbacterium]|jgi:ABC-type multidrug transport system ATPase subunit|uniref:ATP-binding cassette domain-containing protein n=1 Tax=unclassified Microbacterium TaxID=2609290 RepID=UPI003C2C4BF0
MPLIASNIHHRYGRRIALHDVSVEFPLGSSLLLGPNGAGKSTMLEILASLRPPTDGSIAIDGVGGPGPRSKDRRRYREAVAWLPQSMKTYPGVTVREHVALAGWFKGMTKAAAWSSSLRSLALVGLEPKANEAAKTLSGGQTRRLGIAGALVHDAQVLLLDEPTANLDPAQRRQFRTITADLAESRTIVVSSHDTDEAIGTFSKVVVLAAGTVKFDGTPDAFIGDSPAGLSGSERMQIAYEQRVGTAE